MRDARAFLHGRHFDSCVSRCYYALYHLLIVLLEKQGISSKNWKHEFGRGESAKEFVHRRKKLPRDVLTALYDIRNERNEADYNISPVTFKKAKRVFDKTHVLWNNLIKEA